MRTDSACPFVPCSLFRIRRALVAAGVAGHGAHDALDVLEHALNAPETSAGEHDDGWPRLRRATRWRQEREGRAAPCLRDRRDSFSDERRQHGSRDGDRGERRSSGDLTHDGSAFHESHVHGAIAVECREPP